MINRAVFAGLFSLFATGAFASDFSISFTWDGLKTVHKWKPKPSRKPELCG
jgi:hypothetical protein